MPKIIFIEHSGASRSVEAEAGQTLMAVAVQHMVPGLVADCGGNCSCATCHAYIDAPWQDQLAPPSDDEKAMLECALHVEANSRLTCQVVVTPAMDGMVVRTPVSQT